jgi:hypothetical protein
VPTVASCDASRPLTHPLHARANPISTADHTMIGTIAGLASGDKKSASPMKVEVNRFVKVIGIQVGVHPVTVAAPSTTMLPVSWCSSVHPVRV